MDNPYNGIQGVLSLHFIEILQYIAYTYNTIFKFLIVVSIKYYNNILLL